MNKYSTIPEETLRDLYVTSKLSTNKVAEKLGYSNLTIRKALKHYSIEIRGSGPTGGVPFTAEHKAKISQALKGITNGVNPMTGKSFNNTQQEVSCDHCGTKFFVTQSKLKQEHLFCSEGCFYEYKSIHFIGTNSPLYTSITKQCAHCNKDVQVRQNRLKKHKNYFCDATCRDAWTLANKKTPEQLKETRKVNNELVITAALNHYGHKCSCCGETKRCFLVFDHINGGGGKFRKESGASGQLRMSYWLKRNNYPSDIQILCSNCNHAKGTKGACPCQQNNI